MKKIVIAGMIILLAFAGSASALDLSQSDKKAHMVVSALFGSISDIIVFNTAETFGPAERIALATAMGTFPGLLKEIADNAEEGNKFDGEDMVANVIGAFAGAFVTDLTMGTFGVSASKDQVNFFFQKQF